MNRVQEITWPPEVPPQPPQITYTVERIAGGHSDFKLQAGLWRVKWHRDSPHSEGGVIKFAVPEKVWVWYDADWSHHDRDRHDGVTHSKVCSDISHGNIGCEHIEVVDIYEKQGTP